MRRAAFLSLVVVGTNAAFLKANDFSREQPPNLFESLQDVAEEETIGAQVDNKNEFEIDNATMPVGLAVSSRPGTPQALMLGTGPFVASNFAGARISNNNLGGMGPAHDGSGSQTIIFKNIGTVLKDGEGRVIDVIVSNRSEYSAVDYRLNGKAKQRTMGQINVKCGSFVRLKFAFFDKRTGLPITAAKSHLSFLDVDEAYANHVYVGVSTSGLAQHFLAKQTTLVEHTSEERKTRWFVSTAGRVGEKSMDHLNLTIQQQDRSVTNEYINVRSINAVLGVTPKGRSCGQGASRTFLFAFSATVAPLGDQSLLSQAPSPEPSGAKMVVARASAPKCNDAAGLSCMIWGDPHLSGFDTAINRGPVSFLSQKLVPPSSGMLRMRAQAFMRRPVDVNSYDEGDFWLVRSAPVFIQARFRLSDEFFPSHAAVGSVAVGGPFLRGRVLLVEPLDGNMSWNSEMLPACPFEIADKDSHVVCAASNTQARAWLVQVCLPMGVHLTLQRFDRHVDVQITMPPVPSGMDGECGNFNGDAADDSERLISQRLGKLSVDRSEALIL